MEFYNHDRPVVQTMALYDQTEPLQQPIGFAHFREPEAPAILATGMVYWPAMEIEAAQ